MSGSSDSIKHSAFDVYEIKHSVYFPTLRHLVFASGVDARVFYWHTVTDSNFTILIEAHMHFWQRESQLLGSSLKRYETHPHSPKLHSTIGRSDPVLRLPCKARWTMCQLSSCADSLLARILKRVGKVASQDSSCNNNANASHYNPTTMIHCHDGDIDTTMTTHTHT